MYALRALAVGVKTHQSAFLVQCMRMECTQGGMVSCIYMRTDLGGGGGLGGGGAGAGTNGGGGLGGGFLAGAGVTEALVGAGVMATAGAAGVGVGVGAGAEVDVVAGGIESVKVRDAPVLLVHVSLPM